MLRANDQCRSGRWAVFNKPSAERINKPQQMQPI